ncbi:hypothetical protein M8818_001714 [Zalaria obscura]|uniref:Uncharacterized protein n=1 Tax=Zalaria obscura TaxID=2024903 RepID=A0ACC3SJ54_9PEZI
MPLKSLKQEYSCFTGYSQVRERRLVENEKLLEGGGGKGLSTYRRHGLPHDSQPAAPALRGAESCCIRYDGNVLVEDRGPLVTRSELRLGTSFLLKLGSCGTRYSRVGGYDKPSKCQHVHAALLLR